MPPRLRDTGLALLRQSLDSPSATFREGQWEAIKGLVEGRARLLVVQRTGWGKSVVYFLTTRLLRDAGSGPTLLISPLLALMRNQIAAAERIGVRAATINSSNRESWSSVREQLRADEVDILLISPERLSNDEFREEFLLPVANRIGFFVVDEAHCISDWGHDFRPDYLRITRILQALPSNIPVLATTATANDRVVSDVAAQLGPNLRLSRGPLLRESLRLQNITIPSQAARMAWLAEQVPQLPGSGIIYALTIGDAQRVAGWLQSRGIDAHPYWGGQENSEREELERRLLDNRIKALVATTALGMGFDKPDLGFVIHFQRPGSVVHYYQQVGRAGRATREAYGVLLHGNEDEDITEYFIRSAFPPEERATAVLGALRGAEDGLSVPMLERQLNLSRGQIEKVLKRLAVASPAPVSKRRSSWFATAVRYEPDREKIARLTGIRYAEQERMRAYMENRECLMLFLARELDDHAAIPCGRCAVCAGGPILPEEYSRAMVGQAVEFIRKSDVVIEPRKLWPKGALEAHGWGGRISSDLMAEEGRALSVWGDDGWGEVVRRGKQVLGRLDTELVGAVAGLVRERWQPEPQPAWITCVPSPRHPDLVPDFARRLASMLGLPFAEAVRKIRETEPQKLMENSYQQAHNLQRAFEIDPSAVRRGPVLLVDDMVDSGWTFTVVAALLREAGSGPVFPLALCRTTKNDDA